MKRELRPLAGLSIITATYKRPALLANCLAAVQRQVCGTLEIEHIVAVDGTDDPASVELAHRYGAECVVMEHAGEFGAAAKDLGLSLAKHEYVAFWDDDNIYHDHAALTAWVAVQGFDAALCCVRHLRPQDSFCQILPKSMDPISGDFDTACFCVKTEVARKTQWYDQKGRGTDWRWWFRLRQLDITCRMIPIIIADKLDTYEPPAQ